MKSAQHTLLPLIVIAACLCRAGDEPSLTDMGPYETPSRHASGTITYNLGPIGARGWIRGSGGGKQFWGENGREILVTWVDPGSPADGVLQNFDVILGAQGTTFETDARIGLGNAIFAAEKSDGTLRLTRWRDGNTEEVVIRLPLLGKDEAVVPMLPEHSKVIRERALDYLVKYMHPDGFKMHPSYRDFNALYLLAHGRPEHLDHVRRNIREIIERDPSGPYGPWAWVTGMDAILLSEYFQATGDAQVLPALENLCRWMENSRSYAGGWGHGGPYGGYGHVGLPGMFNAIGLVLARECGVTGYDRVIHDARTFYSRGASLGKIGYGGFDADMGMKTIYGDNGKSGTAAVLFDVLDDKDKTRAFSTVACAMAPYNESGHTGHFWSYSWGGIGSAMAPRPYRTFHAETTAWYYTLARTWRGGLNAQPWLVSMDSYAPNGAIANTGGMALWYCVPLQSLRILGGEKSVFAQDLRGGLAEARLNFYSKDYDGCLELLRRLTITEDEQRWADQLAEKVTQVKNTIALTREAIKADLEAGDVYVAERRLKALKPILNDPNEVAEFDRLLGTDEAQGALKDGENYYNAMEWENCRDFERYHRAPRIVFDPKQRETMEKIAANEGYYGTLAKAALNEWPAEATEKAIDLVKTEMAFVHENCLFVGKDAEATNGVSYAYYEFETLPGGADAVKQLTPVKEGVVAGFDLSPKNRKTNFAFVFRTFLNMSQDQEVRFTSSSKDSHFLYVDGKPVIDNGGLHGMEAKHGTIMLEKGRHELECIYIHGGGGAGLILDMASGTVGESTKQQDEAFTVDDPSKLKTLRLKVKASDPVTVSLNGEVVCRFAKKRRKELFDGSWAEWETATLKPIALELLKTGANVLSVETAAKPLGGGKETIGVQLQGI